MGLVDWLVGSVGGRVDDGTASPGYLDWSGDRYFCEGRWVSSEEEPGIGVGPRFLVGVAYSHPPESEISNSKGMRVREGHTGFRMLCAVSQLRAYMYKHGMNYVVTDLLLKKRSFVPRTLLSFFKEKDHERK